MKKALLCFLILTFTLTLTLTSCGHEHEWGKWETVQAATCTEKAQRFIVALAEKQKLRSLILHILGTIIYAERSKPARCAKKSRSILNVMHSTILTINANIAT